MNLYFHEFRAAAFSWGIGLLPFRRWVLGKPVETALYKAFRQTGYIEVTIGYQVVIVVDEMDAVPGLMTLLVNLLAVAADRSLRGLNLCRDGTLSLDGSYNGV